VVCYDDLNAHREQVVSAIVQYCGLPPTRVSDLLRVFGRDAQAGTALARDKPEKGSEQRSREEEGQAIIRILQRHPVVKTPGFVVPGTLRVQGGSATTSGEVARRH
jgi:hypothetical protein